MNPSIELPKDRQKEKVIQLYIDGEPSMALCDGHRYEVNHNHALMRVLKERDIEFSMLNRHAPKKEGDRDSYRLCGAGVVSRGGNKLNHNGKSGTYDIGIDRDHLLECRDRLRQEGEGDLEFFVGGIPLDEC